MGLASARGKRYGVEVRPGEAKRILTAERVPETYIQQAAARQNVTVESVYAAAAEYLTVQRMLTLIQSSASVTEPELRRFAKDNLERVSIEMVRLPAESFADPDETFTEQEIRNSSRPSDGAYRRRLNFGYYIEPRVRIQYIQIDPEEISKNLRGTEKVFERRAYTYCRVTRRLIRGSAHARRDEGRQSQPADADTSGVPAPPPSPFYQDFSEVRTKAIAAVKERDARAEADRIANELRGKLAEPWFNVSADQGQYKAAPEEVKNTGYYDDVIGTLPLSLRYPDSIETRSSAGSPRTN